MEVRGRDLPELFAACTVSLFSLVTDRRLVRPRQERWLRARGEDVEELLFLALREAFFLLSVDRFLVRRARVTMGKKRVGIAVRGEPLDPLRHAVHREIKAITAHALAVERTKSGFRARFVVDV